MNEPIPEISLLGFTFTINLTMRTLSFSEMENLGYEAESFKKVIKTLNSLDNLMSFQHTVEGKVITQAFNVFLKF